MLGAGTACREYRAGQRHVKALLSAWRMGNPDRRSGVHGGRRGARGRPKTEWESLTATEHRVVKLAADGLTNSQIGDLLYISRRTVETDLCPYRKLGIRSRTELAAAATRGNGVTAEPALSSSSGPGALALRARRHTHR